MEVYPEKKWTVHITVIYILAIYYTALHCNVTLFYRINIYHTMHYGGYTHDAVYRLFLWGVPPSIP